ncbi:MAG: cell division protein ZapA [Weeksellaceae bacterium]|jgi:cell division protein ZapA
MSELKVKINIAGRQYPLTINADEEEAVRNAGKEINTLIKEFEDRYAVTDKQDAISMVALQMASKYNLLKKSESGSEDQISKKLSELTQFIERELEN